MKNSSKTKCNCRRLFVYIQGSPPLCQAIFSNKPHTHTHTHTHTNTHAHTDTHIRTHTHTHTHTRVSHSGGTWGAPTPILWFFSKTLLPKPMPPHLKMNPSHLKKKTPPPLKHETSFHEMIPRKNTINNILESS